MGLDLTLQALPPDLEVLEAARTRPGDWQALQFLAPWLRRQAAGQPLRRVEDEVDALLVRTCAELLVRDPNLHQLSLDVDRRWDILTLFLSYGALESDAGGVARTAVRGERELAKGLVATQGAPIRWTEPSGVLSVCRSLAALDVPRASAAFQKSAPEHDDIYKLQPDELEESLRSCLLDHRALTALYRAAAERGYGMLAVLD